MSEVKPYDKIGPEEMQELAKMVQQRIMGLGFALLVFPFAEPGIGNYIANATREDMEDEPVIYVMGTVLLSTDSQHEAATLEGGQQP